MWKLSITLFNALQALKNSHLFFETQSLYYSPFSRIPKLWVAPMHFNQHNGLIEGLCIIYTCYRVAYGLYMHPGLLLFIQCFITCWHICCYTQVSCRNLIKIAFTMIKYNIKYMIMRTLQRLITHRRCLKVVVRFSLDYIRSYEVIRR